MIFFNVEAARNCLLENHVVFTLRGKRRREDKDIAVKGSWYKHKRLGHVRVQFVTEIRNSVELEPYVDLSGFNTTQEWFDIAYKLHKTLPMYLFKVELLPFLG